jgi:diguanylate cyclase
MITKEYVMNEDNCISDIEKEYERIDGKWLKVHYKVSIGLVIFAFIIECIMAVVLYYLDQINTTIPRYIFKYLIFPSLCNGLSLIIGYLTMKSIHIKQSSKFYIISLEYVVICFTLFTIHSIFASLSFIFAIPIVLTTVYSNYRLTIVTAISSIGVLFLSELFITWDPDKISIFNNDMRFINFVIEICILIAFFAICLVTIGYEKEKNVASIHKEYERYELRKKLQLDDLTKINNRRALKSAFHSIEEDEYDNLYVLVMIDIDNFKLLNDTHGHLEGDECLIQFSNILKSYCEYGIPYRFGGDEFCILFKNIKIEMVIDICKGIQTNFEDWMTQNQVNIPLSASFGIAEYSKDISLNKRYNI